MNKYFIAGGVAALAFAAKLAYQTFINKKQSISKQIVIQKLIHIRQYLYPILFEIADIVSTKLIPKGVPPDQAKMFIMQSQQLLFKQNMQKILRQKVYYDVDEESFQYAIQNEYKNDKQIQFYKKQFQQEYEKCFLGIKPQNLSTKMIIINKKIILQIVKTLLEKKINKLQAIIEKEKNLIGHFGQNQFKNNQRKQTNQSICNALNIDQKEDQNIRKQTLAQYKISDIKYFEFAITKFFQQSKDFKLKYNQIISQYKSNVQLIFKS